MDLIIIIIIIIIIIVIIIIKGKCGPNLTKACE